VSSVAQRSRIFRHLTHADSSTTPKHDGTGLGVVTCSQLVVALMGDGIEVDLRYPPAVANRKYRPAAI
jgi:signal transduction histidine kinase